MKGDDVAAGAEIYKRSKNLDRMNQIYRMAVAADFERMIRFFGRLAL